jgi:hypothetical protein
LGIGTGSGLGAFDGNRESAFYVSHATQSVVALEIDLGKTVEVCAGMVMFGAMAPYSRRVLLQMSSDGVGAAGWLCADGGADAAWTVLGKGPGATGVWCGRLFGHLCCSTAEFWVRSGAIGRLGPPLAAGPASLEGYCRSVQVTPYL